MSYVVVLFPEPREVYIDDEGQGSNVAASGRPRLLFVNAGKHTFRLTGADVLPAEQTLDVPEQPILDPFPRVPEVLTRAMRLIAVGLALVAGLTVAGCAVPANPRLAAYGAAGYRYANVRTDAGEEELFVILAFSGGGTRAAAFSYGVLDGLQAIRYQPATGAERSLLDDVDVISSVSGGSFTAAHYALFGADGFKDFEKNFLYRNIQAELVARAVAPWNAARLLRPDVSRIDLAAELYDEVVFDHATFASLLQPPSHRRPYLLLNATDMTLGTRFEFTQDQFDLLCSDLSAVPVARAVAASSAFPVLLSPLTLHNYAGGPCDDFHAPRWLTNGLASVAQPRRVVLAENLVSYRTRVKDRPFVHLLDGGLSDNIGLRGPYVALSGQDSAWSVFTKINQGRVRRVLVITANAHTGRDPDWGKRESPPGVVDVLGLVTTGPMGNYSFETVQLIAEHFTRLRLDLEDYRACERLAKAQCAAFSMPFDPPADVAFHAVELRSTTCATTSP
jgi:predicted acylesterase/phospholipase RssA